MQASSTYWYLDLLVFVLVLGLHVLVLILALDLLYLYLSQCSTLVRNTVVRAVLQAYGKW